MQTFRLAAVMVAAVLLSTPTLSAPQRLSIAANKQLGNGTEVSCELSTVTAAFMDVIYIEQQDRTSGIRVEKVTGSYAIGQPVYIEGVLRTNGYGERYIECTNEEGLRDGLALGPLFVPNMALGGTDWLYDVNNGAGQRGVTDGTGLNNIGLLVRTSGMVTSIDAYPPVTWFYLDDGTGAPVKVTAPSSAAVDPGLLAAVVTGICTRESIGRISYPVIQVRGASDIVTNGAILRASIVATPTSPAPNQVVTFDGRQSNCGLPSRSIASYEWDFDCPDGNFAPDATGAVAAHFYPNAGTYTARLRVTDSGAPARTATANVQVVVEQVNHPPTADPGGPYATEQGFGLLLDGSGSSDPDEAAGDAIALWEWDLDGDTVSDAVGPTPALSWAQLQALGIGVGQRTITLRVTDLFGAQHTATTTLKVYVDAPVAVATADKINVGMATEITFDGSQSYHGNPNRQIVSYQWDFDYNPGLGFQAEATGVTVKHTYYTPGTYVTALRVADDNFPVKTAIATVTTQVAFQNLAPVARPGGPYTISAGSDLQLDGSSSYDPNWPGDTVVAYDWDLNLDGIYDAGGWTPLLPWSYLQSLGIEVGTRTIRLRVTDSYGLTSTATTTLNVYEDAPVAVASADKTSVIGLADVTFNGSQSYHNNPNRSIIKYEWDFDYNPSAGFQAEATTATVKHTYLITGVHVTALRVTDNNVPAKTSIATVAVQVQYLNVTPVAVPGGPYYIHVGDDLQLDGSGSYDPNAPLDSIVAYEWDINNDGTCDISGCTPLLPWSYLESIGIRAGVSRTIRLRVLDGYGGTSMALTTLVVSPS